MKTEENPQVTRLVVAFLRSYAGMTQAELGGAAGVNQGHLSRYESGRKAPTEEILRRLAEAAGVPWPLVAHLRRFCAAFLSAAARRTSAARGEPADAERIEQAVLDNVRLALSGYFVEGEAAEPGL